MGERTTTIQAPAPQTAAGGRPGAQAPAGLPRLLAGISGQEAMTLDEHLAVHGDLELEPKLGRREEPPLIAKLEQADLRGHGGAAFPTATKLRAVARSRGRAVAVVNAAEGEPASLKDRTLLQMLPHLVLDGAQLAAQATGADELVVCACEQAPAGVESIAEAIRERSAGAGQPARMQVTAVPGDYVAGQEAALVNHLNGGPAIPTFTPPMLFERGVRRRPTLVSNAETLAHVALIARHGPEWFRQLGTSSQPGSTLVTLSGPVAHPGVYEIEYGASLMSLVEAAGGMRSDPRAALVGGYGGSWIGGELLRGVALSDEHLAAHEASLGAGVVLLLSQDACPVAETARVARWLADQSSGQCGPCVNGLDAIAASVEQLASGVAPANTDARIARLAGLVRRRGACGHPDGSANLVISALGTFSAEFADHARHGPCEACGRKAELPLPRYPRSRPSREPVSFR